MDPRYGPCLFRGRVVQAVLQAVHVSPGDCMFCRRPIPAGEYYFRMKVGPLYHPGPCWEGKRPVKKLTKVGV